MEGRGKKTILSLEHEGENVTDPDQIQKIIYDYYKKLFGKSKVRAVKLSPDTWASNRRLTAEDNVELLKPFSEEEVKKSVFEMKESTAPGPDGFGVSFYKNCWDIIKEELMEMINDF